jgi:hypothetical protein
MWISLDAFRHPLHLISPTTAAYRGEVSIRELRREKSQPSPRHE